MTDEMDGGFPEFRTLVAGERGTGEVSFTVLDPATSEVITPVLDCVPA